MSSDDDRDGVRAAHQAAILEESIDFIATTDLFGDLLYVNTAFRVRFDVATTDGVVNAGQSLFDFFTDECRQLFVTDAVPELWRRGRWSGELTAIDACGAPVSLWQSAITHRGADGKPTHFSGIARDITEMKQAQATAHAATERSHALLAQGSDVILVVDVTGVITYASPAIERALGYPLSELLGTQAFGLIHPDDLDAIAARFLRTLDDVNDGAGSQCRALHRDGTWRWVELIASNHLSTPGVNGIIINARDITARHEAIEELERAAQLLSSVMHAAASEAIFVTDRTAHIVAFSRGAELLLGYQADEVIGRLHPAVFHLPDEVEALAAELGITPAELFVHEPPPGQSLLREWSFVRNDGTTFDGSLIVSARHDPDGTLAGFLYLAADVSERRRREATLTRAAEHDALTGLANRNHLQRALGVAVADTSWHSPGRVLLFLDLDRFKAVNDTLGHAVGDAVLIEVAQRLRDALRSEDLAVRHGGDEFVILLAAGVDILEATHIAQRIVTSIGHDFVIGDQRVSIGASVGLSISRADFTPEQLLLDADSAAYKAKNNGRGQVASNTHGAGNQRPGPTT